MRRVTTVDGVALDNACFISSEEDIDNFIGTRALAVDGSTVLFVQAKGAMTKEVQIYSKDTGWVTKETRDALIASLTATLGVNSIIVEFDDQSSGTYFYDHSAIPMKLPQLYEGSLWYTVELNLLKG